MKNLIVALTFIFSVSSIQATVATDVYGQIQFDAGIFTFTSLEEDSYGQSVELDENSIQDIDLQCEEGIFTLAQSLRKDRSYQIVDVICETFVAR